ncbi:MAG: hypothetical protein ACKPB3_09500, partial [Bacteroidota bacterium]
NKVKTSMDKKKQECPSCAMMIDYGLDECPICGFEFPKQSKGVKWVAIFLLILFAFYFLMRVL